MQQGHAMLETLTRWYDHHGAVLRLWAVRPEGGDSTVF